VSPGEFRSRGWFPPCSGGSFAFQLQQTVLTALLWAVNEVSSPSQTRLGEGQDRTRAPKSEDPPCVPLAGRTAYHHPHPCQAPIQDQGLRIARDRTGVKGKGCTTTVYCIPRAPFLRLPPFRHVLLRLLPFRSYGHSLILRR